MRKRSARYHERAVGGRQRKVLLRPAKLHSQKRALHALPQSIRTTKMATRRSGGDPVNRGEDREKDWSLCPVLRTAINGLCYLVGEPLARLS